MKDDGASEDMCVINSEKSEIVMWTGGLKRKDPVEYKTEVESALFKAGIIGTELVNKTLLVHLRYLKFYLSEVDAVIACL
jgi:hypothetical protein